MLCLTRRENEGITFFVGDVEVKLQVKPKGNAVRVFIDAPPEVRIMRDELLEPDHPRQRCEFKPKGGTQDDH